MRLLIDINIFLDVACHRPGEAGSAELIEACGDRHEAWVAWHSIATLAYLVERQRSMGEARAFITDLLSWVRIAPTVHEDAVRALELPLDDFEDALQVVAAQACHACLIITRNGDDFANSPIRATTPEEFLAHDSQA